MSASTTLTRAAELLARPEQWTQGAFARDADGTVTAPLSDDAVSFDLKGALIRAAGPGYGSAWAAIERFLRADALHWNDDPTRTHADVLAALRGAAAMAEAEENEPLEDPSDRRIADALGRFIKWAAIIIAGPALALGAALTLGWRP